MSSKRKHVVLSMSDKVKIIEVLNKGMSGKQLAEMYNVGTSTISYIKTNSSLIMNFVSGLEREDGSSSRKMIRTAENKELDEVVFKWFLQQRSIGNTLSGPIICHKAKIFAEKMVGLSEFKASNGWLRNFKARHGIRELDLSGEKLAADKFLEQFKNETKNYDPEFVYNADETGLNWKALPCRTMSSNRGTSAGHKISQERETVLNCAHSTGSHRLPLLLIGKSKNPRAFNNVKNLPLVYKHQTNAWMTAALFTEWFDEVFKPEVKKYQKKVGKKKNVLLFVDNAPTHPSVNLFERENGRFKVLFLPPNVTSLLQPMDQGVIQCMKRHYRRQLLRKLLLADEDEECTYHKKIDLKDCSKMIADSWNSVKTITIKRAWNKLNGISTKEAVKKEAEGVIKESEQEISTEDIQNIIVQIPSCSKCNADDINEWLHCDSTDPGFQILSDDEILQSVMDESQQVNNEDAASVELEVGPSASEAFAYFGTALKWMERQPECDHIQLLTVKRMRDLAARKRN